MRETSGIRQLGALGDNIEGLEKLISYLRRAESH
jgi:hypothetical protein